MFGLFFKIRCATKLVFKISVPQAQKGWEPPVYRFIFLLLKDEVSVCDGITWAKVWVLFVCVKVEERKETVILSWSFYDLPL